MKIFKKYQTMISFVITRLAPTKPKTSETFHEFCNFKQFDAVHIRYNWKMLLPWLSFLINLITSGIFLFTKARTFQDFSESFYAFVTTMLNLCSFIFHISRMGAKIFQFIDNCEMAIDKRKYFF